MTAQAPCIPPADMLAPATNGRVAALVDAPVPAIVLGGDGRTLRFLNAAAGHVLGISHARPMLGQPAPLEEAVLKHLQRVVATAEVGRQTSERIRFYRGIKPIILLLTVEPLGDISGAPAILVTLPELARPNADCSLQATLALYAGADELITIFGDDDVLAVAGRHAAVDEAAPGEIEAIVERAANADVNDAYVRTPEGRRAIVLLHINGAVSARRLLYIGPLEPLTAAEEPVELPDAPVAQTPDPVATEAATQVVAPIISLPSTPFAFNRDARPQRFTWQLDQSDRFVSVGPELGERLGPEAAPRIGESWHDAALRLSLDPGAAVAQALHARQAWHGRTIAWPAEATALRVPVDLTAMPLTDPDGHFAGFRGFGVIRPAAAVEDPLATELWLGKATPGPEAQMPPLPDTSEPEPSEIAAVSDPVAEAVVEARPEPLPDRALLTEARFPRLVPAIDRASDDHFVTLMPPAHISPETLRLTGAERNAFRQIAEALGARFEGDEDNATTLPLAEPEPLAIAAAEPVRESSVRILSTQELLDQLDRPTLETTTADILPYADWRKPAPAAVETQIIDRLPVAVGLTRDEAILHVNPAFLALTGYADLAELNRAGGLDALFAGPHAAKGWSDDHRRHHIPLVTNSGRVLPVDARIASVPWTGGTGLLITLVGADRPGTAPVAAALDASTAGLRDALADAEQRLRERDLILAAATDGILTMAGDGRILTANPAAEALFGVLPDALIGERLVDLMAPESRRSASDYLDGVARNGIGSLLSEGCELTAQASPDRQVPLFVAMTRISTSPEPMFAAVLRDISRWKTSEEELTLAKRRAEEASLQKSDFLAKISHEIRTPLNAIIGFSEVMLGERFGAIGVERYKDYLSDIQSSGTHIMSLVNDLLDLSKVEAGKLDLKFESVQLVDILTECVHLMQPQANRERIIIRASLTQGLPPVVADLRSIRQIVLNLLSNAIKFTPAGGQVIVSAALEDSNEVVIRVRDTGYGMSAGDIEIAMEPFRQVHNGRGRNTSPGSGTGLGLPLTKALVEANRAALKIDSAVNQGTLVQVTFPAPRVLAAE